jgi:dipeptidase E
MKLLLTSNGIENNEIASALTELVGKPASDIKIVFIPTAANTEAGDKTWLIEHLMKCKEQGYAEIAIVDIAAVEKDIWFPQFENADVICFGGGDQQYLADKLKESGAGAHLPALLATRVYMGISAGSMVAGDFMPLEVLKIVYHYYPDSYFKDWNPETLSEPLHLAPLVFIPHMNSPHFQRIKEDTILPLQGKMSVPIYALDDQSALKITDSEIEVVGGGEYVQV